MSELDPVQRFVLRGSRARHLDLTFVRGDDALALASFIAELLPSVTFAASDETASTTVGVSAEGLRLLGISERAHEALPAAFTRGMRASAERLGDVGSSDPARWVPPFARPSRTVQASGDERDGGQLAQLQEVHLVVVRGDDDPIGPLAVPPAIEVVGSPWAGERRPGDVEPFGFRDGVSEPVLEGAGREVTPGNGIWDESRKAWRAVRPGELVLGHVDESGAVAGRPDAAHLERDGSYLVVRRLQQDVAGFRAACVAWAEELRAEHPSVEIDADLVAAQLVGRHRDGTPLGREGHGASNDFLYRHAHGQQVAVPPSSHIRRANPRDDVEFADRIVARHQLWRRGIPYRESIDGGSEVDEGLLFLACCADLRRQFEVVQGQWLQDGARFGLGRERDPIVGNRGTSPAPSDDEGKVSIDVGGRRRRTTMAGYVTMRGGEYFLVPGRDALRLLASVWDRP
ncbi:MAG: Dyp-type peroxidase [Acidimicrobiales bacterium]|nr:Dyp-type peroxidase [Acidimicrobiales bacterium]